MSRDHIEAAARLGGRAAGGVVNTVEHVHRTIADRAFGPTAPASAPVRLFHDGIASVVYAAVRAAVMAGGAAAGTAAGVALRRLPGNYVLSALNAVMGDQLAREGSPLAIAMTARADGPPTARLAVFVHGLGENEQSWRLGAASGGETYGSRLAEEFGCTPVYLRYNTGRHISTNGRELAGLLQNLVATWPVQVDEVLLVGHSMGGLVIRSACHYGEAAGDPWVSLVHHVVYLGSPHAGAPLARGVGSLAWALGLLPETRPYQALLDQSPGVRDLRFGYLLDEDWAHCDAGTCRHDHSSDVPLLTTANHYVVSGSVGRGPAGRLVGDLLVQPASAHGRRRLREHIPFPVEHTRHYPGLHHFSLLNHPDVYAAVRDWVMAAPAADSLPA